MNLVLNAETHELFAGEVHISDRPRGFLTRILVGELW